MVERSDDITPPAIDKCRARAALHEQVLYLYRTWTE